MSLEALRADLEGAGLDVTGPLPASLYDASVTRGWYARRVRASCRSILLVGHSGRAFWQKLQAAPEASHPDPVDTYTRRVVREAAEAHDPGAPFASYLEQREGQYLPLLTLAERAGLGAPSRLGLLLHPRLGPWWALRGALFLEAECASTPEPQESPCTDCHAPCASSCHGRAVGADGLDREACLGTRLVHSACHQRCDARLACVVGREHAYEPEQLAHHARIEWTPELRALALRALERSKPAPG